MAKKTTVKAVALKYGTVGGDATTPLMGVLKGLTPIPAAWGAVPANALSTEVDHSKYHIKNSYGLQVNNATKMMHLQCKL